MTHTKERKEQTSPLATHQIAADTSLVTYLNERTFLKLLLPIAEIVRHPHLVIRKKNPTSG
jgi:hypothetical protein